MSGNNLKWLKDIYEFDESFIKNYNEESDEGYFIEVQCSENLHNLHSDFLFFPEKNENWESWKTCCKLPW